MILNRGRRALFDYDIDFPIAHFTPQFRTEPQTTADDFIGRPVAWNKEVDVSAMTIVIQSRAE